MENTLTLAVIAAWLVLLALLAAPLWRVIWRRSRSLDALWSVLLLGVANRVVSDFAHPPAALQEASAITIAVLLAAVIWSYQRADT